MSADFVSLACCCCRCVSCSLRVDAYGAYCELCFAVEAPYSVGGTRSLPAFEGAAGAGFGWAEGLAADGTARATEDATSDPSLRAGFDDDEPIFDILWRFGSASARRWSGHKAGFEDDELTKVEDEKVKKAEVGAEKWMLSSCGWTLRQMRMLKDNLTRPSSQPPLRTTRKDGGPHR